MPLSWNEIRGRALVLDWIDTVPAERVAFLFERYQVLTSMLPRAKVGRRPRKQTLQ